MSKIIVFEGPDGCGKTTHLECVVKKLKSFGYSVEIINDFNLLPIWDRSQRMGDLDKSFFVRNVAVEEKIKQINSDYILVDRWWTSYNVYQRKSIKRIVKDDYLNALHILLDISVNKTTLDDFEKNFNQENIRRGFNSFKEFNNINLHRIHRDEDTPFEKIHNKIIKIIIKWEY